MDAFCQELKGLNPKLIITNDASQHDMYYICKERGHHDRKGSSWMPWDASYEVFAAQVKSGKADEETIHQCRLSGSRACRQIVAVCSI